MRGYFQRQTDSAERILQFQDDHLQRLAIPRATFLFTKLRGLATAMRDSGGTQCFGNGGYRAGASERRALAKELRVILLDMAATARGLEPEYPGISSQFRLGRQASSHQRLIATAHAFLMAVEPAEVKVLFTDRAFPLDFEARLTAKIAALAEAVGRKASGLQSQKEGTSRMAALSRQMTATLRELRALMVTHLRYANPTLLQVWIAAARVYSQPKREKSPAQVESASGEPAQPAPLGAQIETVLAAPSPAAPSATGAGTIPAAERWSEAARNSG